MPIRLSTTLQEIYLLSNMNWTYLYQISIDGVSYTKGYFAVLLQFRRLLFCFQMPPHMILESFLLFV